MLPLKRRIGQAIVIDLGTGIVRLRILGARGRQAKLGFEAPAETHIMRVGARRAAPDQSVPAPPTED
jgi:sRNA-binding carbon storage regulator CsrA